jgi:gluconolactonase
VSGAVAPDTSRGVGVIVTDDLALPEGPLLLPDGSWLVTELDVRRGTVTQVFPDGSKRPVAKTGRPNGLALGRDGAVWVAESLDPGLLRLDLSSGEFTRELSEVEGRALRWPNDLCFGPDGALYATDSGILVGDFLIDGRPREGCENLPGDGLVLRLDPRSGEAWLLDEGLRFANGIAFGPDGLLYANETMTGNVYRYTIGEGHVVGERELFGNVLDPDFTGAGMRGPDGMAFSTDGRLWVTVFGQGDITVLDQSGAVVERLKVGGRSPTNCAFGPAGTLYVVEDEHGCLETVDVGVDGLALHA